MVRLKICKFNYPEKKSEKQQIWTNFLNKKAIDLSFCLSVCPVLNKRLHRWITTRSTIITFTDNFQTIFDDFCTAFVCVSEIKKKLKTLIVCKKIWFMWILKIGPRSAPDFEANCLYIAWKNTPFVEFFFWQEFELPRQTIVRQNRRIFLSYFLDNILQKACGKFEFLSNNCSARKVYFSILLYRHWTDNLKKIDCCSNLSNI
jgi:hypothetical protein